MASPHSLLERERKFDLPPGEAVPDLSEGGLVAYQSEPVEERLDATYYDTADYLLARSGVTLRRRSGGGDDGWHLKLPVSKDTREELSLPLGGEEVPAQFVELTRSFTRGEELLPLAGLRTTRSITHLVDDDGRVVATLTDDQVTGEVAGPVARLDQWREIELELAADVPDDSLLDELGARLTAGGARESDWPSKLRRLMGDLLPPKPEAPGRKASAGEIVLFYLGQQAEALRRCDPGVRRDAEDAVHQMRVAARRLRSALKSFRRVLDRDAIATVERELKWLGGELGHLRDGEVLRASLTEQVAGLPRELTVGPVEAYLERYFEEKMTQARTAALHALDSPRYLALLRSLDELLDKPPLTAKARRDGRDELRHAIVRADRRLRRAEKNTHGTRGPRRDVALHELRKKAKQARYTADAARPAFGKKVETWRKRVKAAQSVLGDHHDSVVARSALRDIAVAAHEAGYNAFSYGVLHGRNERLAETLDGQLAGQWKKIGEGSPSWL